MINAPLQGNFLSARALRWGATACFGSIGLCMAWLASGAALDAYHALAASRWDMVTGTVMRSGVDDGCGIEREQFHPTVRYRYKYQGERYFGTRIQFGSGLCGSRRAAESLAGSFPPGRRLTVYVNPGAPNESVLVAGRLHTEAAFWLAVYTALAGGTLCLAWRHFRDPALR